MVLNDNKKILPDFIVGGVPKSGTTSLGIYLSRHPDIQIKKEECHFFDEHDVDDIDRYHYFFDDYENSVKIIGERTPSYFYDYEVPNRVKKIVPKVKLIFLFRNPVDRAYSDYWHHVRWGAETRPFQKSIYDEKNSFNHNDCRHQFVLCLQSGKL